MYEHIDCHDSNYTMTQLEVSSQALITTRVFKQVMDSMWGSKNTLPAIDLIRIPKALGHIRGHDQLDTSTPQQRGGISLKQLQ
jgi:hypothetical protein